jgi:hypothetical protein
MSINKARQKTIGTLYLLFFAYFVNSWVDIEYHNMTSGTSIMVTTKYQKTEYLTLNIVILNFKIIKLFDDSIINW